MRSDHPYINPTVIRLGNHPYMIGDVDRSPATVQDQNQAMQSLAEQLNSPLIRYGWLGVNTAVVALVKRNQHPIVWWLFGAIPLAGFAGQTIYKLLKKTGVET